MKKLILGLIVLSIVFLMGASGCGSQPSTSNSTQPTGQVQEVQPPQAPQEAAVQYSASDCSVLSTDDVQSVFNTNITQDKGTTGAGSCAKQWISWNLEGGSRTPLDHIALAVTNTTLNFPGHPKPSESIARTCANKPSVGLGDSGSCSVAGDIFFSKGDYLVEVQCVNCPDGNAMKLANLANSRL